MRKLYLKIEYYAMLYRVHTCRCCGFSVWKNKLSGEDELYYKGRKVVHVYEESPMNCDVLFSYPIQPLIKDLVKCKIANRTRTQPRPYGELP